MVYISLDELLPTSRVYGKGHGSLFCPFGGMAVTALSLLLIEYQGWLYLAIGQLPAEVINAILCNLPVDISFIDADDKVAYYSDSSHRIFPRSLGVIGRDVKNCHPPKSLHVATEILEPFKRGERNKAEFWLELGGKFIRIQYLALRNKQGTHLGCLEVGQDATHFARCRGSRLLAWE